MMNAVGGTSIHYYANSWRFHPWDFQARSQSIQRYGPNSIPKGSTLEDWPLTYADLEPYYDTIEHEIGVSGKAGNIQGQIDQRGNVFEGPRRREYPMPPLRDTDFTDLMQTAARKLGFHPHRSPAAINSQPYGGRSACAFHGYCDTGGCHVSAKNSTAVTTIPAALKTKNLKIFERSQATRIVADNNGKATGVLYLRDGQEYFQPAKVVLLSSYTYENVRLLLLSKSKGYPNGLVEQSRPGGQALHWSLGRAGKYRGAFSLRPEHLVRRYRAGRGGERLGRGQLRPFRPRLHRRRQHHHRSRKASHRGGVHADLR